MKILFIVNGNCEKLGKNLSQVFFTSFDVVVCVDGGLNNLIKMNKNITPNYIIGDFDSIDVNLLNKYRDKSKIIKKDNQDESDLYFAIKCLLEEYKIIDEITILCGVGSRLDHSICNIILLNKLNIKGKIISDNEEIYLLKNKLEIKDKKDWTLSLIPLTKIKNISSKGLKWQYENTDLDFGFINGISNIIKDNELKIIADDGVAVVIITSPENII